MAEAVVVGEDNGIDEKEELETKLVIISESIMKNLPFTIHETNILSLIILVFYSIIHCQICVMYRIPPCRISQANNR